MGVPKLVPPATVNEASRGWRESRCYNCRLGVLPEVFHALVSLVQ